jgi:hypothetical protein
MRGKELGEREIEAENPASIKKDKRLAKTSPTLSVPQKRPGRPGRNDRDAKIAQKARINRRKDGPPDSWEFGEE